MQRCPVVQCRPERSDSQAHLCARSGRAHPSREVSCRNTSVIELNYAHGYAKLVTRRVG